MSSQAIVDPPIAGARRAVAAGGATGDVKDPGTKSWPVPASAVVELGDITVNKNIDRNGDGSFGPRTDFATRKGVFGQPPNLLAVADLNGDSKLDAIVAGWDLLSIFLGNGDGTFGARMDNDMGWPVYSLAVADFNGDSNQDLAYPKGGGITVLFGNGDGSFRYGGLRPTGM